MKRVTIFLLAIVATACGKEAKEVKTVDIKTTNKVTGKPIQSTVIRLTGEGRASVKFRDNITNNVIFIVNADIATGEQEGRDVLLFEGQIHRDFIRDYVTEQGNLHQTEEDIDQKTFSGQLPARGLFSSYHFPNIFADVHCINVTCYQLYIVVKKESQDQAMGSFTFYRDGELGRDELIQNYRYQDAPR